MSKYVELNSGGDYEEVTPINSSNGVADAAKIIETDASGRIDESFLPTSIGPEGKNMIASEALSAGDFVNVWDDAGTPKIRKANATTAGKRADGFVKAGVATGAAGFVYFRGLNDQVSGAVAGLVFLSTTPGGFSATGASDAGNVVQKIGTAVSATEIAFEPQPICIRV